MWEHLYLYGGVPSGVCDHHSGKLLSGVLNMNDRPIPDLKRAVQKMRHLLRYYVVSQLLREPEFIKNEPATMHAGPATAMGSRPWVGMHYVEATK